jgi:eukaryotic-like serine/threonine-protein kinase
VPRVKGMTKEAATSVLTNANLKVQAKNVSGKSDATLNTVVKQNPDEGEEIDEGSTVTIDVNVGPKQVQIPDNLIGKDVDKAKKALEDLDFDVEVDDATDEPLDAEAGEVLDVDPKEGSTHDAGTTVTLIVATGESPVPNLVGRTVESAQQEAEDKGFEIKVVNRETTDEPPETIFDQDPKEGTMLPRGETITVYKAVEPEESSPPPSSSSPPPSGSFTPPTSQSPGGGGEDVDADADADSDG